jgi:hypothetical protein
MWAAPTEQARGEQRDRAQPQPTSRALWLGLASAAVCVLVVARHLVPDARGFGTHVQLGLPPCGFLSLTGLPCPACGLTTCFAYLAHGELSRALHANPLGVVLFAAVLATPPAAMWASARNCAFFETFARMRIDRVLIATACIGLTQWLVRVACLLLR